VDESHAGVRAVLHDPSGLDSVHIELATVAFVTPQCAVLDPGKVSGLVDVNGRFGSELPRTAVLRGRRPARGAPDEATIGFAAAEAFGLRLSDEPQHDVSDVPLRLVGIEAQPYEFPSINGATQFNVVLTAAFADRHPELVDPDSRSMLICLRPGSTSPDVARLIKAHDVLRDLSTATPEVERSIRIETVALMAAATIVGLVSLVPVAQLFRREVASTAAEHAVLRAVGFDRRQFLVLGVRRGAVLGMPAIVIAVLLAMALSPRLPVVLACVPLLGLLVAVGASGAVALAISPWPARHVVQDRVSTVLRRDGS
jgi:FtsX-like permease family